MATTKQRTYQHVIDHQGQQLLREKLPKHWVLREYRPDYGLDFALEVFRTVGPGDGGRATHETLGEHFFIQLKSIANPTAVGPFDIYGRGNVEKSRERLQRGQRIASIETYRFSLEMSELVTIERMGTGVPVLLVIADLTAERCCFVCLNDYIDKILIPRHDDYRSADSRTVHVPVTNQIGTDLGLVALRWYAKRAKLIAAFQRFTYQYAELQWESDGNWEQLANYFAQRIVQYDFWDDTEMCVPLSYAGGGLRRFLTDGQPGYIQLTGQRIEDLDEDARAYLRKADVFELWRLLSLLPKTYEDVWREWFLPSALGHLASSP